jgi:hypothetical protein
MATIILFAPLIGALICGLRLAADRREGGAGHRHGLLFLRPLSAGSSS